jgi:hypothetical protein
MAEDFAAAAIRHFRDAKLLDENDRVGNADQLYGFAAECAIKVALVALPALAPAGRLADRYREHVDQLWRLAPVQSFQKRFPGLVWALKSVQDPFADWTTSQRYEADGAVPTEALERHRKCVSRLLGGVYLAGARQ